MSVEIIGQDALKNRIDKTDLDTFPRSLVLKGDKGSGKHLMCKYISEHLCLELIDVTDIISLETINEIMVRPTPALYLIDGSKITVRQENAILKFLEEPLKNSYVVILCEALQQLLDTIRNRCQVWVLDSYKVDDLKTFLNGEDFDYRYQIANTPGKLLKLKEQDVDGLFNLCETIIDKIGSANYANTLTITDKLALSDERDKFDIGCFIDAMSFTIMTRLYNALNQDVCERLGRLYSLTTNLLTDCYLPHINKTYLIDNYLTNVKRVLS